MLELHSSSRDLGAANALREEWRARLHGELTAKAAQQRRDGAVARTIIIGVAIGLVGSAAILFLH